MTAIERINSILAPFLQLPAEQSEILITNVLGASSNWLILQYLGSLLTQPKPTVRKGHSGTINKNDDVSVVLVSWLQQWEFWRTECRRTTGIDLQQAHARGQFAFVDGLTSLFLPKSSSHKSQLAATYSDVLERPYLDHLQATLLHAMQRVKRSGSSRVVLFLDAPNILLQTTRPRISTTQLNDVLLTLRGHSNTSILAIPSDNPFLSSAASLDIQDPGLEIKTVTPLEADNAAFIAGAAHRAKTMMQCRRLDTGWAEDVSGVLRITRGGAFDDEGHGAVEEGEWLYHVANDGVVKIWSRRGGV